MQRRYIAACIIKITLTFRSQRLRQSTAMPAFPRKRPCTHIWQMASWSRVSSQPVFTCSVLLHTPLEHGIKDFALGCQHQPVGGKSLHGGRQHKTSACDGQQQFSLAGLRSRHAVITHLVVHHQHDIAVRLAVEEAGEARGQVHVGQAVTGWTRRTGAEHLRTMQRKFSVDGYQTQRWCILRVLIKAC